MDHVDLYQIHRPSSDVPTDEVGNSLQRLVFLAPHLFVLSAGVELWPLLLAPFVSGWLFGWLLYRSGSILPGWLAHSLAIALAAAGVMS